MGEKCSKCKPKINSDGIVNSSLKGLHSHSESAKDSLIQYVNEDSFLSFEKKLTKYPENSEFLEKLAFNLYEKGLTSQSFECFSQLIKQGCILNGKSSMVYAKIQVQSKDYQNAIETLEKSLSKEPENHKIHSFLGELYAILEINDKSFYHTKEALKIDDTVSEYHNNYGLCMMKQKNYSEALTHFLQALDLDHHMAKALNNAGNAYRKLGNIPEAKKCYNAAISLVPRRKFPIALINLATTCFYTGDILLTLKYFEEALQTGSNIHKIMVKKGYHLLFKNPKTKFAIELLCKKEYFKSTHFFFEILKNDSHNPVVCYYMGLALTKLGRNLEANDYYKITIE